MRRTTTDTCSPLLPSSLFPPCLDTLGKVRGLTSSTDAPTVGSPGEWSAATAACATTVPYAAALSTPASLITCNGTSFAGSELLRCYAAFRPSLGAGVSWRGFPAIGAFSPLSRWALGPPGQSVFLWSSFPLPSAFILLDFVLGGAFGYGMAGSCSWSSRGFLAPAGGRRLHVRWRS